MGVCGRLTHAPNASSNALKSFMDVQAYNTYWQDSGEALYTYSPAHFDKTNVDDKTFSFLTTCGLPSNAAPALSFSEIQEDKLLTPNQVFHIAIEGLDNYLLFGSNGSGDPVCIDTVAHNEVVYLNHDNYFERVFMNSNVWQLGLCLIKYRQFRLSLFNTTTSDYTIRKFSDAEFDSLKEEFLHIDKACLAENTFWYDEPSAPVRVPTHRSLIFKKCLCP